MSSTRRLALLASMSLVMLACEDQEKFPAKIKGAHQGGAMRFGADGKLYVTIGEHTSRDPAQSLESTFGKLLRFNAGQPRKVTTAESELSRCSLVIWSADISVRKSD